MTVTIVYADSTDGYIVTGPNPSYSTMRSGWSLNAFNGSADLITGQALSGGDYTAHEAFVRWPFTAPAGEVVTGAGFRFYQQNTNGVGVARDLEIRQYAYATPLSTASFRPGNTLSGLPLLATVENVNAGEGKFFLAGSSALMDLIAAGSSTISTVIHSSRFRAGTLPTGFEQNYLTPSEGAGTTNDAALIFTSAARSTLFGVLAGSVRLSDGSWAVLESDGGTTPVVTLRRHTGAAVTTIATIPIGTAAATYAAPRGAQGIALAVDASDNLYVLGAAGNAVNSVAARKYAKGSGWTWTAGSVVTSALPAYSAPINQVAAAWHGTGDSGTLLVMAGHAPGTAVSGSNGNSVGYVLLSAATLAVASSGSAPGAVLPQPSPPTGYFNAYTNETGSVMDVAASSSGAVAGYVASVGKDSVPGDNTAVGIGRYEAGSSALTGAVYRQAGSSFARKDGSAKIRVVPTGPSTVAVVTADPDAGWGITVVPYQATASGWTALAQAISLDGQGITGMPAASALAGSQAWDVTYLARDNKLWVYYPDSTDGRIVRRTGVDLTTYQATKEAVTVSTVGASGGTNLAVRVARNGESASGALVTVAHKASGGALSTVYVLDAYNVAPTEPTLTARGNFDATASAVLSWTFNDPNLPSDGQTAYQLQIVRVSDVVVVVDTGKVTSTTSSRTLAANTLTNGVAYQWRVRTYDQGDLVSPWSPYGSFSTGAGGTVTITSPAADNPPGIITDDLDVSWSVSGTTQAQFRVWVTRDDTGATIHDSFLATGTQTTWHVTSMVSDVQHTIHVMVWNASSVASNEATRKVTPSYGTPDKPSVAVSVEQASGYVLVTTINPAPSGDRPVPTVNRVWRRAAGSGEDYVMIGSAPAGDEFRDYTARSGVAYEYRVEAVA